MPEKTKKGITRKEKKALRFYQRPNVQARCALLVLGTLIVLAIIAAGCLPDRVPVLYSVPGGGEWPAVSRTVPTGVAERATRLLGIAWIGSRRRAYLWPVDTARRVTPC